MSWLIAFSDGLTIDSLPSSFTHAFSAFGAFFSDRQHIYCNDMVKDHGFPGIYQPTHQNVHNLLCPSDLRYFELYWHQTFSLQTANSGISSPPTIVTVPNSKSNTIVIPYRFVPGFDGVEGVLFDGFEG